MEQEKSPPAGPDLTQGVALADFTDDKLAGHVGDDEILLVRSANEIFAIAAHCRHSALRAREIEVHVVAPEKLPRGSRRGGACHAGEARAMAAMARRIAARPRPTVTWCWPCSGIKTSAVKCAL